jgi:acetyl-CoA/propionyl-CoA carboxylase biotin carboxyl carrier protein
MLRALRQFDIAGVPSTIPFHQLVLSTDTFIQGCVTTPFVAGLDLAALPAQEPPAAPLPTVEEPASAGPGEMYAVDVNGKRFTVRVAPISRRRMQRSRSGSTATASSDGAAVTSPMHGVVLRVVVEPGQVVSAGDLLMVIEAMKMENEVVAHRAGTVTSVTARAGDAVEVGTVLATIEAPAAG